MIKHSLNNKNSQIIHEVKYPISKKELQRVRMLLDLSFDGWEEDKLDKLGIVKDTSENIIGVAFNDGALLDWNLCCGQSNYYDDVLFQRPNGEWETLDCTYEFDDIEIDAGTDIYIVKLDVQDE